MARNPFLNWFGFNIIQEDAFCVELAAASNNEEQKALEWELNKYAQLSLPATRIGGVESFL